MNTSTVRFLSKRLLRVNVGFLLSAGPGNSTKLQLDLTDPLRIADDLVVNSMGGTLRLSRTKEGILLESRDLLVAVDCDCARCLETFEQTLSIELQELFAFPQPIDEAEFSIGQDAQLDFAPLLRAEVLLALSQRHYCRPDCKGLCVHCGTNLNYDTCDCEDNAIDPRMAQLRELLDAGD